MSYKFLMTVNFFMLQKAQHVLGAHDIICKIEDPYHFNVTAGWADPFCNNNERNIFVLEKDFSLAKKILEDKLK